MAEGIATCRIYAATLHEAAHAIDGGIDLEPVEAPCRNRGDGLALSHARRHRWRLRVQPSVDWTRRPFHSDTVSPCPPLPWTHAAAAAVFLFCHPRYQLSPLLAYRDALGRELESFATLPVREILTTSSPPAFAALWQANVNRWTKNQSTREEKVA